MYYTPFCRIVKQRLLIMKKKCTKCSKEFPDTSEYFHRQKKGKGGLCSHCKECRSKQRKKHNQENREETLKKNKKWREANPKKNKECKKKYRQENLWKIKAYKKNRYHTDIEFRLLELYRNRLRKYVKSENKSGTTKQLIGCSIAELKQHLEKQFDDKMSWENYGSYWHVDHIIPCASFDLTDPEQQKECFHYTNLQPLEAIENKKKGKKILF